MSMLRGNPCLLSSSLQVEAEDFADIETGELQECHKQGMFSKTVCPRARAVSHAEVLADYGRFVGIPPNLSAEEHLNPWNHDSNFIMKQEPLETQTLQTKRVYD